MADLHYLIEREREEELRVSTRELTFPDGTTHRIEAFRLVWRWFDRLADCEYTYDSQDIIAMIPRCAAHEGLDSSEALARVVGVLVGRLDREGIDITEDTLQFGLARKQMERWDERRAGSHGDRT